MKKIVIVEDHPVLKNVYKKKFTEAGYSAHAASSGGEGLDLIKQTTPDLVLLDLGLPDMDGIEVLRQLRADPAYHDLPIFVFSGEEWAEAALSEGATMVVSKSTRSPGQLVTLVRNLLPLGDETSASDRASDNGTEASGDVLAPNAADDRVIHRVLLVEDHTDTSALISYVLNQSGCVVTVADTHASAMTMASPEFNLYLLNRFCADGLGLSLCADLRGLYPSSAVVMYSTAAHAKEREDAVSAGADAYLTRPEQILNPLTALASIFHGKAQPSGELTSV